MSYNHITIVEGSCIYQLLKLGMGSCIEKLQQENRELTQVKKQVSYL